MYNLTGKRASELWGPLRKLSPEELKAVERTYAHFHRVLGELLQELAALPEVVWLGDEQGHEVRGEGEENIYRKAIYPVADLTPYREQLAELEGVQAEGLRLLGRDDPPPGLLLPGVLEGVQYARLHKHTSYVSQALPREQVLSRLEGLLESTKANLRAFERYATTYDPRREKVEGEVKAFEAGVERLKGEREALLRMRTRHVSSVNLHHFFPDRLIPVAKPRQPCIEPLSKREEIRPTPP